MPDPYLSISLTSEVPLQQCIPVSRVQTSFNLYLSLDRLTGWLSRTNFLIPSGSIPLALFLPKFSLNYLSSRDLGRIGFIDESSSPVVSNVLF